MTNDAIRQHFSGDEIQTLVAASCAVSATPTIDGVLDGISEQITISSVSGALTGDSDVNVSVRITSDEAAPLIDELDAATDCLSMSDNSLTSLIGDLKHEFTKANILETSGEWVATFDGACRGNPGGEAGYGVTLSKGDVTVATDYAKLSSGGEPISTDLFAAADGLEPTNNVAEYVALHAAIRLAREHDVTSLTISGDSELIIKQMTGEYSANADLSVLRDVCQKKLTGISVEFTHQPRGQNAAADALANKALDEPAA